MTDEQIIGPLEWCGCEDCVAILDLINRQKAEIEKYKIVIDEIEDTLNPLPFETDYNKAIKQTRLQAANDFADQLLGKLGYLFVTSHHCVGNAIDEILKEWEENTNAN